MLTIVILTKNNQNLIRGCLDSVEWADEIVVVDNGSTDATLDIVKNYTRNIVKTDSKNFSTIRELAMAKAKGDWVLYIDSDERVLKSLREEIQDIILSSDKSAFAISRKNIILGKEVRYKAFWPDWVVRLIKKEDFTKWVGEVHEYPTFNGKLGYTENSLLHLTHRNIDQIVLKSLEWADIDARLRLSAKHPKMSGWRFIRILLTETFNQGIKRGGFFNGSIGVMDSLLQTFSLLITYMKLWEMQQPEPLNEVYRKIDEKLISQQFDYE